VSLLLEALGGGVELEGPQEVVGSLEVVANGPDLVDEVLNAGNTLGAELALNDGVVVQGDSGAVDLAEAAGVDQLADGGAGGETVGDEVLNLADHVPGGLVELHKHTVVDLTETEELHDLSLLGGELVDTADSHDEGDLGLTLDEEGTGLLGITAGLDKAGILSGVLLGVLLSVGKSSLALGGVGSLCSLAGLNDGLEDVGVTGSLLDEVLGHNSSAFLGGLPKTTSR